MSPRSGPVFIRSDDIDAAVKHLPADNDSALVFCISRREVEQCLTGSAVDRLLQLSDSTELTRRFADKLILSFDGFDADPREMHQIPSAVTYFRELTQTWPFWAHFCEKQHGTIGVALRQLVDVDVTSQGNGEVHCALRDPTQLSAVLDQLTPAMFSLQARHGYSHAESTHAFDAFMSALDGMFTSSHLPSHFHWRRLHGT